MNSAAPDDRLPPDVRAWTAALSAETRASVEHVSATITAVDQHLSSAVKWNRLTIALDEDWHHWLCGLAVTKAGSKLMFHKGAMLADPAGVLRGSGRYIREIPLAEASARADVVRALVAEAIVHRTDLAG